MYKTEKEHFVDKKITRYFVSNDFDSYKKLSKFERLKKLKLIFEEIKPDIIISFLPIFACYAILATKFNKRIKTKPKIIYCVALYQRRYKLFSRVIDLFDCMFSNAIFLQCKEQFRCNWLFKKKCVVNYNPIDLVELSSEQDNYLSFKIMCAGRLTKQKNFMLPINAVHIAHKVNKNITLDIYGNGPLKDKLNREIEKLNASNYIKIHSFSFNIKDEFKKHNIFILSSKYEGFPNALAEAMMSNKVCLSTKCHSGPKEMIVNGNNGFFFKNKKDLSLLLTFTLPSSNLAQISSNARKFAIDNFETSVVLPKFIDDVLKK